MFRFGTNKKERKAMPKESSEGEYLQNSAQRKYLQAQIIETADELLRLKGQDRNREIDYQLAVRRSMERQEVCGNQKDGHIWGAHPQDEYYNRDRYGYPEENPTKRKCVACGLTQSKESYWVNQKGEKMDSNNRVPIPSTWTIKEIWL